MNIELSLMELNQLYYAISKLVEQNESHLKELGRNVSSINYFKAELHKSEVLRDKIQTALYDECKRLDEAIKYVEKKERDYSKFKEYADRLNEEIEPEYDSAGFTEDDRIVNGQYRVVSNEEADEDYRSTLTQDELRYTDSMNEAQSEDRKLGNI